MRARVGLIVFMVLAVAGIATAVDQPMINYVSQRQNSYLSLA